MVQDIRPHMMLPFQVGSVGILIFGPNTYISDLTDIHFGITFDDTCGTSCSDRCAPTCTGDGRKWNSLAGMGGSISSCRAAVARNDPSQAYRTENIAAHEFAHTLHMYVAPSVSSRIDTALAAAKAANYWVPNSYAMSNKYEYFAEASQAWFGCADNHNSGGMGSAGVCRIRPDRDGTLWQLLKDFYGVGPTGMDKTNTVVRGTGGSSSMIHFDTASRTLVWR
jgi:hypothetical protein